MKKNINEEDSPLSHGRGDRGEGKKGKRLSKIPLHAGARPHQFKHAKKLRQEMTKAEKVLWEQIRGRRFLNLKFRQQHPILDFIVDFYCHERMLIVEVDGQYHKEDDIEYYDSERTKEFERYGFSVLRFSNEEVLNDIIGVLSELRKRLKKLSS